MTDQEIDKQIRQMEKIGKELSADPVKAKQFLVDIGLCTPTGRIRKPYRPISPDVKCY